ncbi:MAG: succinate dehydrogenase assembly factor 2, partial [Alphaproteobacteria bacterium]
AQHRGTKETDILIGGFVARHIASLTDAEVTALEEILELWDVDLADWLSGRRPIPPEHDHPLLRRIMAEAGGGP